MSEISSSRGLHRVLYASRFSDSFPQRFEEQEPEITKIISRSIANNRSSAITGLLLVHQQQFLQVLEGPAEKVMETYNRILADVRHNTSRLISAGPAESRSFGEWNMCARRLSSADDAILKTLDLKGNVDPSKMSAETALTLLTVIAGIQRRTMAA